MRKLMGKRKKISVRLKRGLAVLSAAVLLAGALPSGPLFAAAAETSETARAAGEEEIADAGKTADKRETAGTGETAEKRETAGTGETAEKQETAASGKSAEGGTRAASAAPEGEEESPVADETEGNREAAKAGKPTEDCETAAAGKPTEDCETAEAGKPTEDCETAEAGKPAEDCETAAASRTAEKCESTAGGGSSAEEETAAAGKTAEEETSAKGETSAEEEPAAKEKTGDPVNTPDARLRSNLKVPKGVSAEAAVSNTVSAQALADEQEEPLIGVKITDSDWRVLYHCTSKQSEGERMADIADYYSTLNVFIAVTENPSRTEGQRYSGIEDITWALVPAGTGPEEARKSRVDFLHNTRPADEEELDGNEEYGFYAGIIDSGKLVEKLAAGEKGYEKSGPYDLYFWAVDFCGNGEDHPLRIPLLLDVAAPSVTVQMEKGTEYEGKYYYRADNDEDDSNDGETAAVTVRAAEDRREGSVSALTAVLKGTVTKEELSRTAEAADRTSLVFTVEDLKKHFGNTEQEITIKVSASDNLGNKTSLIEEEGTKGVRLHKDAEGRAVSAEFIRDAAAPLVTMTYGSEEKKGLHLYRSRGDSAGASAFTAYTGGNAYVKYAVKDAYAGNNRLFWTVSGSPVTVRNSGAASGGAGGNESGGASEGEMDGKSGGALQSGGTEIVLGAGDGQERSFTCSAYGTDIAGNPAAVEERFAAEADLQHHPADLSVQSVYTQSGCGEQGDYHTVFHIFVDKKAPAITLTYSMNTDADPRQTAFIYDDHIDAGNTLTAYISGTLQVRAMLDEDEDSLDFDRLFYQIPGKEALSWKQASVSHMQSENGRSCPCIDLPAAKSDGEYLYRVYGTDKAGNRADITERFDREDGLRKMFSEEKNLSGTIQSGDEDYAPYYAIVIDTTPPAVTKIETFELEREERGNESSGGSGSTGSIGSSGSAGGIDSIDSTDGIDDSGGSGDHGLKEKGEAEPFYYEDDRTFYYKGDGLKTVWKIDERNYDGRWITAGCRRGGILEEQSGAGENKEIALLFTEEGKYENIFVRGTDRAGNHLVVKKDADTAFGDDPGTSAVSQNSAVTLTDKENGGRDSFGLKNTYVELARARIIDRKSPTAVITHVLPDHTTGYLYPETERGSSAAVYSRNAVTTKVEVSDTYGEGKQAETVLLDGSRLQVHSMFHAAGEPFSTKDQMQWEKQADSSVPLSSQVRTEKEGHYAFSVKGTDRAGNPVIVQEKIVADAAEKAVLDTEKGHYDRGEPAAKTLKEDETYSSFYVIVYDKTPPVYRLAINNPLELEETFDRKTGIAYYGKSVSSICAIYTVSDNNFDEERILAGIAAIPLSGAEDKELDSLFPGWSKPDRKGKCTQKMGSARAVFSLMVDVDKQHEGMYRFEIEGCDKAGNILVPSSEQAQADRSAKRSDLAAKTEARDTAKGQYWTQRKAVDVTAPTGFLKVESVGGRGDSYYEIRFEAGQNLPLIYEPFRRETSARVVIGSSDASPTSVCFDLRSQDSKKDAAWEKKNPFTSAGEGTYADDNTLQVTVKGEQAFYLENIVIKDRAGNVRDNDHDKAHDSKCTLSKTGNIYLDVTSPAVSAISDAESPQVRIMASGSFTRHEADSDRYIYRPDGSALDLQVSVTDPGGRERSSGLREVTVEVRVGNRVVTDRVSLDGIPYSYEKGDKYGHNPLKYEITNARIRIPTGSFAESNDITITVKARDNSGNESIPARDGGLLKLGIDTQAPRVEVNYHDTVEPRHGRYFRADRVAEIVVIDRNVDNGKIKIDTNTGVPSSFSAPHGNKESDGSGEAGNEDRWIKMIRYDADGDYTLRISGTDALGNRISDIKWNGPAPEAFTVDKTKPLIRITLPGEINEKEGVKYYDRGVRAAIEIEEHNFYEETDRGLLNVDIKTAGHGGLEAPSRPVRSAFEAAGGDLHRSTVDCGKDGDYEIAASYVDMAGNEAVVKGGEGHKTDREAWSGRFTVDTEAPELILDPETFRVDPSTGRPLEGLEKQIYTDRDFAPRVIIREVNYDEVKSTFSLKKRGADGGAQELTRDETQRIQTGGDESRGEYYIQFQNFEMVREMDGVYRITAEAVDLARHKSVLDFTFSVNRFGSTWAYADDATEKRLDKYYINDTQEPLRILELSPVELQTHAAELFKDHERRLLTEGRQYTFEQVKDTAAQQADRQGHCAYVYTIAPQIFEEEGVYDFILSSEDIGGNENTTALFRDGRVKDGEICQSKFSIEFQVDKTVPVNRITGVPTDREQFNTERLEITVYPEDYQTEVRDVEIKIGEGSRNGKDSVLDDSKYMHFRAIGEEEDAALLAKQHVYPIEDAGKGIPVVLEDKGCWQFLEVITTDLAGNTSTDFRMGDPGGELPDTRRRFLVTTNPLIRFFSCRPVFYGTIAAILLLFLLLLFLRRRKDRRGGRTIAGS